jgi:schlafen family protein
MLIHGKQFADLEESDLRSLVDDQVAEGKTIEYKSALPNNSDRDKKEFLADISSFSNSAGGYIFFGISETNGLPIDIGGLRDIDPDAQILRFENLLRDSISPRLPGISIRAIPIENNGPVLAIHIPKSWASPHMVTYAGVSKFFSRNSAGKYPLDVFELRSAFNATNIEGEQLRTFRTDRIGKIISNETPVALEAKAKVILHLIPISAFVSGLQYDLREFQDAPNRENLAPISATYGSNLRFNFDGILTYEQYNRSEPAVSYLQLFRNGIIESVNTSLFEPENSPPYIPSIIFEQDLIYALGRFSIIQNVLETEPPYFLLLTLLGVQGYNLPTRARTFGHHNNLIDRNDLLVPEILVEDITLPAATILRPAFDAIWNAAAQPQSPFYDTEGNWNPK